MGWLDRGGRWYAGAVALAVLVGLAGDAGGQEGRGGRQANRRQQQRAQQREQQRRQQARRLEDARVETYRTVGDVELKLYVFSPEGAGEGADEEKRAAVVFFFGGGWRGGSPGQFVPQAKYLASRGMVAVCADYRVESRHGVQVAECVEDAKAAMRYVRANADRLGIDPARIASAGGSAGGHLAAAVGTLEGFNGEGIAAESAEAETCRPNAMLLFNPALDLTAEGFGVEPDAERIRALHARLGAEPEAVSPSAHVAKGVAATIVFHGTDDATVPFSQAEAFAQSMRAKGNRCELASYEGAGHGFFNYERDDGRAFVETMKQADAFLRSMDWIRGEATIEGFAP